MDGLPLHLQYARLQSRKSECKIKVGAVIVRRGKPLAMGCNIEKSHPAWVKGKCCTIHGEIAALIQVAHIPLRGSTVYVYREHKDGKPALARPCANCQTILKEYGVKTMVYSIATEPYYMSEKIE